MPRFHGHGPAGLAFLIAVYPVSLMVLLDSEKWRCALDNVVMRLC